MKAWLIAFVVLFFFGYSLAVFELGEWDAHNTCVVMRLRQ